jgi:hypothetical protein
MRSPARRASFLLRQHTVLLVGPWLGACAFGFAGLQVVLQVANRLYPVVNMRAVRDSGGDMNSALAESIRTTYIRLGAVECVAILECALKIVVLALTVLLVAQVARYGADTLSDAMERLRKVPAVTSTLLKFFLLVLVIGVGTTLIATVPVLLYIPGQARIHGALPVMHGFLRWGRIVSSDVGRLLFVLCAMPFFLSFVAHFLGRPSSDEDAHHGLLGRALGYGTVAFAVEVALGLLLRPLQVHFSGSRAVGAVIWQSLIGLAVSLTTSLPTILCVVVIVSLAMGAETPVAEVEPASLLVEPQRIL